MISIPNKPKKEDWQTLQLNEGLSRSAARSKLFSEWKLDVKNTLKGELSNAQGKEDELQVMSDVLYAMLEELF